MIAVDVLALYFVLFFFKQKTAYEMRISDWSSDVCSSDLELLDADITMVLDECTPFPATEEAARESMERSMRWAARCKAAFSKRPGYGLFGIVQGSVYPELRRRSAKALTDIGFDG